MKLVIGMVGTWKNMKNNYYFSLNFSFNEYLPASYFPPSFPLHSKEKSEGGHAILRKMLIKLVHIFCNTFGQ